MSAPPVNSIEVDARGKQNWLERRSAVAPFPGPDGFGESPLDRNPDLWLYRGRTVTLLRRYLRYSLETGRIPSILGSEFFRTAVTNYSVTTFEDRVLFVHDVEVCLQLLDEFSRQVVARVVLQEHSQRAAGRILHCSTRTIERCLFPSLDRLSEVFLEVGLLAPNVPVTRRDDERAEG
jgi:DNA-directed RNA polymerase specialized sigma24 family protein